MADSAFAECAALVRRYDPDRFLTALFASPERREDLLALYAFNLEVAKIRELVSEPILGQIRLQWWREAIAGLYEGHPRAHPVAAALATTITRRRLDRALFDRLIDGREADLAERGPADFTALVDYAAATSGSLVQLALQALGVADSGAGEAGRELGIAWALIGLLRAVPYHAAQKRIYLPSDLLAAAGASAATLFDRGRGAGIESVVRLISGEAAKRLADARRLGRSVPRSALPALLAAPLADIHLADLRRAGWDPFALPPGRPRFRPAATLMLASLWGRF